MYTRKSLRSYIKDFLDMASNPQCSKENNFFVFKLYFIKIKTDGIWEDIF